jgi:hypothetical protein
MSTIEEILGNKKVAVPVWKAQNTAVGIRHDDHVTPYIQKVGSNFADKRRSLGRYSALLLL